MDEQGSAADEDINELLQYPFFTEGTNELLQARIDIANYSLPHAKARVDRAKLRLGDPDEDLLVKQAAEFVLECSEIGDDRPVTGCSFSRDASMLATSSWSGMIKVWSIMPPASGVAKIATLRGHTERATDVAFSPVDNNFLATASADKTAKLWNSDDGSLLLSFHGHLDRLARLAFHPSGRYLGTASFDKTWRLWDVSTGTELLLQEGHSRGVYGVGFHPDGSLAASCGLDAHARVWDLRSGRSYCTLTEHVKPVLGVSFSPNGHLVATAGEDGFCQIWDLRTTTRVLYSIPAHKSLISQVKFEPQEGCYLATSSYDTTARIWSTRDYKPIKSLAGQESRVTGFDISGDGQQIVTVSHDRTIKMWSCRSSSKRHDEMELD